MRLEKKDSFKMTPFGSKISGIEVKLNEVSKVRLGKGKLNGGRIRQEVHFLCSVSLIC